MTYVYVRTFTWHLTPSPVDLAFRHFVDAMLVVRALGEAVPPVRYTEVVFSVGRRLTRLVAAVAGSVTSIPTPTGHALPVPMAAIVLENMATSTEQCQSNI